jgi:hypothetical protein
MATDFHLEQKLRMSGVLPLIPPICCHCVDRDNFTHLAAPWCFCNMKTCMVTARVILGVTGGLMHLPNCSLASIRRLLVDV